MSNEIGGNGVVFSYYFKKIKAGEAGKEPVIRLFSTKASKSVRGKTAGLAQRRGAGRIARFLAGESAPSLPPSFEMLEGRQMMSASTISAVSFMQREPVLVHLGFGTVVRYVNQPVTAVFSINANGQTYESTTPGISFDLGGNVEQISAGLDAQGQPEVYGIAPNHTVWVYDAGHWSGLGGDATQISASVDGTVYARNPNNNVVRYNSSGWFNLGGDATQISAGVDPAGNPEVFATGTPITHLFVNDGHGWAQLNSGGQFSQISASINGTVYGINTLENNSVEEWHTGVWTIVGGQYETQISAGLDATGKPEVFATGANDNVIVDDGNGWASLNQAGCEIAAPAISVGVPGNSLALVALNGQTLVHGKPGFYSMPAKLSPLQLKYQEMGGPSGSLGEQLDAESPIAGTNGTSEDFYGGSLYWSPATGVQLLQGLPLIKYLASGGPDGSLGFPTTGTSNYARGSVTYFQNGKIVDMGGDASVVLNEPVISYNFQSPLYVGNELQTESGWDMMDGTAGIKVNSNGSWALSYDFNNYGGYGSGIFYTVAISIISPTGTTFVFQHSYDIHSYDNSTITGTDPRIAADWADLQGCQIITRLYHGSNPPIVQDVVSAAAASTLLAAQSPISQIFNCSGNGDTQLSVP